MKVVNSKEFATNEDKYFDMAMNEQVFVQRDGIMFIVARVYENKKKKRLKPDDDFRRAISMDEFLEKMKKNIHQYYKSKRNESSYTAGS